MEYQGKYKPIELPEQPIKTIEGDSGRYYVYSGDRVYPSVTTILSKFPNEYLKSWIENTPENIRKSKMQKGALRGNKLHSMVESYLKGEKLRPDPLTKERFLSIKKHLDRITVIHAQEEAWFSDRLKIAGRIDCIGIFDDKLSIIDFKTASRAKDDIQSYYEQETAYALMLEDTSGIKIEQIVTIMAIDESPVSQLFIEKPENFIQSIEKKVEEFYEIYENSCDSGGCDIT